MAYRAGAKLEDIEFVQFHPTTLQRKGEPNFLISEAVRGAGGILRNVSGEAFMERYDAARDLAPRDIVSRAVFEELKKEGVETETIHFGGKPLRGCTACVKCVQNKDKKCVLPDDGVNGYVAKMEQAEGIILASPVYFSNVTAEMKALIDRAGMVGRANGDMYRRKAGAAVVAVRRGGAIGQGDGRPIAECVFPAGAIGVEDDTPAVLFKLAREKNPGSIIQVNHPRSSDLAIS
jgi:hypothetical protein